MNVLLLTTHLDLGGIPRYVINLSKGLKGLGDKVWVASSGGAWQAELGSKAIEHLTIPIKTKSIASPKILDSFLSLSGFLEGQSIDIIHANTRVTQALGCLLHKRKNIPYVSTFHGCYRPHILRRLLKFQGVRSIAVSNFVKSHTAEKLKVDQDKIRVVYNGMDIASCLDKARLSEFESIKQKLKASPLIGTVSRLSPEKNIGLLIEAMPRLIERFPDIRLVILGQGRSEAELKARAKTLSLKERVIFLKGLHPCSVLKDLDVFISLSKGEPFGFSIIEAQVLGVPVIALASGAFKETIQDKHTGLLVESTSPEVLTEALSRVFDNKQLRDNMTASAQKRVEQRFSDSKMAEDTRFVYQEAIKR
jgi:glycosyltransferase involved in cell wall biosynthesis